MKPVLTDITQLRVLVYLSNVGAADAESIGKRLGPSWRSGATWAGTHLRRMVERSLLRRRTTVHGRYVYELTDEGRRHLSSLQDTCGMVEATWTEQKRNLVRVLRILDESPVGLTVKDIQGTLKPDVRSREWVAGIIRRLVSMDLVAHDSLPTRGRPVRRYSLTSRGRDALNRAYVDGSSAASLGLLSGAPTWERPTHGDETR